MNNGNAHQSAWSADFHAARGDVSLPCPVVTSGFAPHAGTCKQTHPRGITVDAAGRWRAMPPFDPDDMVPLHVEHYA